MQRELTWQAVLSAVLVAAVVSASYPYVVLKLGMGPNVSVVSAFLGAILLLFLSPGTHGQNRLMNNVVQTAGTSAASTAFMCIIAAAVDLTFQNPTMTAEKMNGVTHIDPWPMFWWLSCAGCIGVLFTVLFRRHFLDDPRMIFPDGVAAAETIVVLDSPGRESTDKLRLLGLSAFVSALVDGLREAVPMIWKRQVAAGAEQVPIELLPSFYLGSSKRYQFGIEWNLLSVGSGLLVGLNVSLSLLAGSLIFATFGPRLIERGIGRDIVLSNVPDRTVEFPVTQGEGKGKAGATVNAREEAARLIDKPWDDLTEDQKEFLKKYGGRQGAYMNKEYFPVLLLWFMWPATGLMIAAALTAVLVKWRDIVRSFSELQVHREAKGREDVSLRTVVIGSILFTAGLAVVQHRNFNMSYVQTVVAVICSLPLILVGIRVLGETNNGPISVMMNGLQAVFAVFWHANVGHNLIAAGMTGTCNSQAEGTMQDYKTGKLVGSTPRVLTWVQLAAVPIGAAAVAVMYPILIHGRHLGSAELPAPTGVKISNMAVLLSQGLGALPSGALLWTVIASVAGVFITLAKHFRGIEWLPSPVGIGFGLLLPATLNIPIAIGGLFGWVWEKTAKASYDRYAITVASGLIGGEALLGGLVLPVIAWLRGSGHAP